MTTVQTIDRDDQLNAIADPRRRSILSMLMVRPVTITQIGERVNRHPAWVRHHVQTLVRAGLAELTEERTIRNYTEKYYAATARAFQCHLLLAPESGKPSTVVALGSHDLGLELLAADVVDSRTGVVSVPVGSLDGLITLRQGLCDVAGCHLFDDARGEYNVPFLRHLFPDIPVVAVTLAEREQGIITAPQNPHGIRDVADLTSGAVRFANRNPGSGTRVWLEARLRALGFEPHHITGFDSSFETHTAVARAVAKGDADAGIGLRAAAEALGLGFQPLFQERYDLVVRRNRVDEPGLAALLASLGSLRMRRSIGALAGYDTTHTGEEAPLCA